MVILIDEGLQRQLAQVRISGNKAISTRTIEKMFKAQIGEALDQSNLIDLEKELRNEYVSMGYLYAQVALTLDYVKGMRNILTTVNITVDEGVLVKIGEITVQGLVATDSKVVYRELYFATGDNYDPELIDRSRRALLTLGLFRIVQIIPADRNALSEKAPVLDILIDVREGKPGKVSFGPGWRLSRGNRFNAESSYNNIGGVGRQVYARAAFSEETNQHALDNKTLLGRSLSVGYLEPYILGLPVNATASASDSARADEKWLLTKAGEVALVHRFRYFIETGSIAVFYGQKVNREESSGEQKEGYLDLLGGNVRTGRIGLRFNVDKRNDLTWPSKGFLLDSEFSVANFNLVGDLAYKYWEVSTSAYQQIIEDWVLACGITLASFQNIERKGTKTDVLPASETLHAGGADSVRGYRERSLGPRVEFDEYNDSRTSRDRRRDIALGGSNSALFKLELRYQIVRDTLAISHFIDSGNVFFSRQEIARFRSDERQNNDNENAKIDDENAGRGADEQIPAREETVIRDNAYYGFEDLASHPEYIWDKNYLSYGLGLNYLTPLGSINLAYGLPWKNCVAEDGSDCIERGKHGKFWLMNGIFHINVGANF